MKGVRIEVIKSTIRLILAKKSYNSKFPLKTPNFPSPTTTTPFYLNRMDSLYSNVKNWLSPGFINLQFISFVQTYFPKYPTLPFSAPKKTLPNNGFSIGITKEKIIFHVSSPDN